MINAPGNIVASVSVDANHMPKVDILSAKVGGIDIPAGLLTRIDEMIDNAITNNLNQTDVNFQIDSITITDRTMLIELKRK